MKTPIDNGTPGATEALLNGGTNFQMVDLWQITLNGGAVIRWHSGGMNTPLTFNGQTYLAGPLIDRGKVTTKLGLETATLDMKVSATTADLISGGPIIPFAVGRGFDGATVILYRAFLASWAFPFVIVGAVIDFSGRVTQLKNVSRSNFTMTVSSWTVLLDVNMGPDVFQAGCLNQHYDTDCGLTATLISGAVGSGASTQLAFQSNLTQADGYFNKGILTFTSGANAGVSRAVQTYLNTNGALAVAFELPAAPASGDAFTVARGCLLTLTDCKAQRSTLDAEEHFRGQCFTPPSITGNGV